VFESILDNEKLRAGARKLSAGSTLRVTGLWGSSAAMVAAATGRLKRAPVLLIARHGDEADELADDLEVFTGRSAATFPAWEVDLGTEHVNDEITSERLRLLNQLLGAVADGDNDAPDFIVAPVLALLQPVPTPETLRDSGRTLEPGQEVLIDELAGWLVDAGFEHVEQVDQQGEFAHRGGIVDVFPPASSLAVRIEFFGDEIDSIRQFDLDTQRSIDALERMTIASIAAGRETTPGRTTNLLDYLPAETVVALSEPAELADLAGEIHQRVIDSGWGPGAEALTAPNDLLAASRRFALLELTSFAGRGKGGAIDLGIRSLERLVIDTGEALAELEELSEDSAVWVFCETQAEQERFAEMLSAEHPKLAERVHLATGHVHAGFHWPDQRLVVVGHHEIFHRYSKVRRIRRVRSGRPIDSLLDLSEGDYVVHIAHGIARFAGLRTLERDGRHEEFLTLKFADAATMHVPVSQIGLVQRYVGTRGKRPTLSKLGGASWSRAKTKVSAAVKDLAAEMLRIQAMRNHTPGHAYPGGTEWQRRFVDEFLYTETEDQLTAAGQISADLTAPRPMDRLLCGDVGYGKTELAMRAAFKVVEAGRQVAVLVPTTVLADQHHRTFRERFADYPFRVDMISRFRTAKQTNEILRHLAAGQIDILIGTHRLLSKDVKFSDLGLVVIDEEQRFGVEHKERLKSMRASVEVLTMTATPIPRTLHMALLGLRDISSLTTPPMDRRAIHTEVVHYDEGLIRKAILRELNRGGQVFFVHNRVNDIRLLADRVRSLVPDARIAVGHGQMPQGQLESTMLRFIRGEIDVLVCTTIIESGLDIPSANTMLIHNADHFGLAELHQLRGRVGRYKHRAFCYLMLPENRLVSTLSAKRLKAIEEFSDLGAGFQIAMRDLELRGAGNILGHEQSGHIATVGYELYCQLLESAVRELRGEPPAARSDVHLDLGLELMIPKRYVPAERQRMEIYRRLVRAATSAEIRQVEADLRDAYGPVPGGVSTLLDAAEIRILAGQSGIKSIIRMDPDLVFTVSDMQRARKIFDGAAGSARLADSRTLHWRLPSMYRQMPTMVTVLLKRLRDAASSV
jgi:transcription-repair coupling factor (superfamily II helicase)